jgi:hypothetical protein
MSEKYQNEKIKNEVLDPLFGKQITTIKTNESPMGMLVWQFVNHRYYGLPNNANPVQ